MEVNSLAAAESAVLRWPNKNPLQQAEGRSRGDSISPYECKEALLEPPRAGVGGAHGNSQGLFPLPKVACAVGGGLTSSCCVMALIQILQKEFYLLLYLLTALVKFPPLLL